MPCQGLALPSFLPLGLPTCLKKSASCISGRMFLKAVPCLLLELPCLACDNRVGVSFPLEFRGGGHSC